MTETITCRWVSDICRMENGFTVAVYRCVEGKTTNTFRARGQELPREQRAVILTGEFQDTKYGRTFVVTGFELKPPDTKKEFIKYASALGIGLGKVKAKRLFELCGPNVWQMIEDDNLPAAAFNIAGKEVYEKLAAKMGEENTERAIMKLLDGMVNVDLGDLRKANITTDILRENPYTLCIFNARFTAVDEWAQEKGLISSLDSPLRIEAALHEALKNAATNGSCCLTKEIMLNGDRKRGIEGALSLLNAKSYTVSPELAHEVLLNVSSAGRIVLNSGQYYAKDAYFEEVFVAKKVVEMLHVDQQDKRPPIEEYVNALKSYEESEGICLSDEQEAAVLALAQHSIMIVTGYPGAGKTTTIKAMLHVISKVEKLEREQTLLLSPTGKAARRMEEATGFPASTVLSALKFNGANTEDILRSDDPLDAEVIIVDEVSMMDLQQMAMLLRHVSSESRLILIGDPDQLPSVGAGNVLLDLIRSREVPVFLLSKIYRQKSAKHVNPIPGNAALIREGNVTLSWERNEESAFMIAPRYEDESIFKCAINLYTSIVRKSSLSVDDVCLLVPYRKKNRVTKLTSSEFNLSLQQEINPVKATDSVLTAHGISFHKGDKVMQLKNTEGPKNGDVGYIEGITYATGEDGKPEKVARINFNGTIVEYRTKEMQFVDLAYASSVHKMQGAQADTVILVVSGAHGSLLARNLVYTAITRATKHVIVVGELEAFNRAILRDNTVDPERARITLLASRIHHEAGKTKKPTKEEK